MRLRLVLLLAVCVGCGKVGVAPDASTCPPPLTMCGEQCVDLATDTANCNACGTACDPGQVCTDHECIATCPAGQLACNGECVTAATDDRFCGASADCVGNNAGTSCPPGNVCDGSGHCALSCDGNHVDCNGTCIDPATDRNNCGATADCTGANAGVPCGDGTLCNGAGACATTCAPDRMECNGQCIDPLNDRTYCGATDCAGGAVGVTCPTEEGCRQGVCESFCNLDVTLVATGAIQQITVPPGCPLLRITAAGAQGGTGFTTGTSTPGTPGGLGALVTSTVTVTAGDTLTIIVGQMPPAKNGGGGGSFVIRGDGTLAIAAGGGGGGAGECCGTAPAGFPGLSTPDGSAGADGGGCSAAGGTAGTGGAGGTQLGAGGGAGFLGAGADGTGASPNGLGGQSVAGGWVGGGGASAGGFGGGGGSSNNGGWINGGGGGGGGYSGGGGGCGFNNWGGGGGGGSFNPGTNPINQDGVQAGNGFVRLTHDP